MSSGWVCDETGEVSTESRACSSSLLALFGRTYEGEVGEISHRLPHFADRTAGKSTEIDPSSLLTSYKARDDARGERVNSHAPVGSPIVIWGGGCSALADSLDMPDQMSRM